MRIFRIKVAAFLIALFALAVGPFLGTAAAAGKIALVTDLGGRGDLSFNDMGFKGADEASAAFDIFKTQPELVISISSLVSDFCWRTPWPRWLASFQIRNSRLST